MCGLTARCMLGFVLHLHCAVLLKRNARLGHGAILQFLILDAGPDGLAPVLRRLQCRSCRGEVRLMLARERAHHHDRRVARGDRCRWVDELRRAISLPNSGAAGSAKEKHPAAGAVAGDARRGCKGRPR
eukprot:6199970-Pleurochrysis_carterae.AAC.1